jgi:hypothetical protein
MALKDEWTLLCENAKHDAKELYDKAKLHPLISLFFIFSVVLLVAVPHYQVSEINNATERVTQENQARTSLAQIFGGAALGIGLYYTWRRINIAEADLKFTKENLEITKEIAKDNLKVAQEGQITERYTRAVNQLGASDQLGNPAIEIRLGGIYALERIANESEKDYWSIMEILTAYIRKNTSTKDIKV